MARRGAAGTDTLPLGGDWSEDCPTALRRGAPATAELLALRRVVVGSLVLIIVHELRAGGDRLDRLDEDPLAIVDCFAIRIAGVIDESRLVSVDRCIDHRLVVDGEQERVVTRHLLIVVSLVGRAPGDA